ncbi:MAG: protein kinase [Phycisphaerales bacterium]|nr:MAG: protein kinase [Phycisphaerales bacterium]
MEPSRNGNTPTSRDDFLIDAARREVLGTGGQSTSEAVPDGEARQSGSVESPHVDGEALSTQAVFPSAGRSPKRIAHYHVTRIIASGGMGTVYEATQDHPRRTVAIKVMRQGITSPRAVRRFEYESQILARLHHPGIAHVYEAGWHEEGGERLPYFALEYIPNARNILKYADQKHLSLRERLKLFIGVCQAVQHGHQRGVIHRDLKPGNILIDAVGDVKIIDFGVARSTFVDLNLTAFQTSAGELVGTLKYMSPEQCQADPQDLDIRSDIYSLGVLLFELLSGRPPYDLYCTPIISAPRVICEEPPTRLSSINRTLRGDIETIVGKALEKDRQRRYQSALALADDIQRYLNHEPILARPPSALYRLRKLVRRRRVPIAVASILIALGIVVAATQVRAWYLRQELNRAQLEAQLERQERDRLASEASMMEANVLLSDFQIGSLDRDRVLQACNQVLEVDDQNAKAYAVRARVHFLRSDYDLAESDCAKALELEPKNVLALRTCAIVALDKGEFNTAGDLYERALEAYKFTIDLPRDFFNRARLRRRAGKYEEALKDNERAVALVPTYGLAYKGRGLTRYMLGQIDGAIEDLERAASLGPERAVQCYQWIWEMRMLRDARGDREAAEEALNKAQQTARSDRRAQGVIAVWRGQRGAEELLSSLRDQADQAQAYYYFGAKALVQGRREQAAEYFEKAADHVLHQWDEFDLAQWHLSRLERE